MGLIDRIFGNGKERDAPGASGSTQFHDSTADTEDSQPARSAPRRELLQVILRDTMRQHGIPSDWIESRILSTVSRSGRKGMHVNFVVRKGHDRLITYVFAFQDSFERELARFEPRARDWLVSLAWEFEGFNAAGMPDPHTWAQSGPAPLQAVPGSRGLVDAKADKDVQDDLKALFAIRDAALADAAGRARPRDEEPDFQPTQPFEDDDRPGSR